MVRTLRRLEDPELAAERQTTSLAALAITLALVVASLYLVHALRTQAEQQDCILTGRTGCSLLADR
jgi:hypothetical protein